MHTELYVGKGGDDGIEENDEIGFHSVVPNIIAIFNKLLLYNLNIS